MPTPTERTAIWREQHPDAARALRKQEILRAKVHRQAKRADVQALVDAIKGTV